MELGILVFKRIKILSSNFHVDLYFMAFQEGFTKLWTGLGPNVARNAIINAAELASYDQVKQVRCISYPC
jgi:hypothetical protein